MQIKKKIANGQNFIISRVVIILNPSQEGLGSWALRIVNFSAGDCPLLVAAEIKGPTVRTSGWRFHDIVCPPILSLLRS